ncbi:hypothetical protein AGMMS50268_29270 [Spirochaetia bacterium]|nr:hypothetical protein AGMMS50268_29270 [Spirochaetia bacterium]
MSKYKPLWEHLQMDGSGMLTLTFEELKDILDFEIDHSFLTYKKEAIHFGYQVSKISMKKKYITFNKLGRSPLMYCRLPW